MQLMDIQALQLEGSENNYVRAVPAMDVMSETPAFGAVVQVYMLGKGLSGTFLKHGAIVQLRDWLNDLVGAIAPQPAAPDHDVILEADSLTYVLAPAEDRIEEILRVHGLSESGFDAELIYALESRLSEEEKVRLYAMKYGVSIQEARDTVAPE